MFSGIFGVCFCVFRYFYALHSTSSPSENIVLNSLVFEFAGDQLLSTDDHPSREPSTRGELNTEEDFSVGENYLSRKLNKTLTFSDFNFNP